MGFARCFISLQVSRESLLEHERDALAHHTDGVDGVHQRFRLCVQQVAFGKCDHQKYHSGVTATFKSAPAAATWGAQLSRDRLVNAGYSDQRADRHMLMDQRFCLIAFELSKSSLSRLKSLFRNIVQSITERPAKSDEKTAVCR